MVLFARLTARLPERQRSCLHVVCLPACLLARLRACRPVTVPLCRLAFLRASLSAFSAGTVHSRLAGPFLAQTLGRARQRHGVPAAPCARHCSRGHSAPAEGATGDSLEARGAWRPSAHPSEKPASHTDARPQAARVRRMSPLRGRLLQVSDACVWNSALCSRPRLEQVGWTSDECVSMGVAGKPLRGASQP